MVFISMVGLVWFGLVGLVGWLCGWWWWMGGGGWVVVGGWVGGGGW